MYDLSRRQGRLVGVQQVRHREERGVYEKSKRMPVCPVHQRSRRCPDLCRAGADTTFELREVPLKNSRRMNPVGTLFHGRTERPLLNETYSRPVGGSPRV